MPEHVTKCISCARTDAEVTLRKCSVCHRYFCDEHVYLRSGRPFCSDHCADYFFFGDEDD